MKYLQENYFRKENKRLQMNIEGTLSTKGTVTINVQEKETLARFPDTKAPMKSKFFRIIMRSTHHPEFNRTLDNLCNGRISFEEQIIM